MTRRFGVKFLVAASVLFAAAGLTASANAQQAMMHVFEQASGTITPNSGGRTPSIDLSERLGDIHRSGSGEFCDISTGIAACAALYRRPRLLADGSITLDVASGGTSGAGPTFAPVLEAGHTLLIRRDTSSSAPVLASVILYRTDAVHTLGDFLLATVVATAATAGANQFFIDSRDGTRTTTPSANNVGYVAPPQTGDDGSENNTVSVSDSGNSKARDFAYIGAGVFAVGAAAVFLSGGDFSLFNFAPDAGFSATESGYSYNYGARMDFRKDRWNLYWTAGQTNANGEFGEFRYESGGEYRTDFWTAAFSESVQGETADYDFSLSADFRGGIWKVSPVFAVDSRYENGEFTTTNSFRVSGEMRYDDWRFSVSGDTERMQLFAVHRF